MIINFRRVNTRLTATADPAAGAVQSAVQYQHHVPARVLL